MGDVLLDVNVLVALVWPQHVHHVRVRRWLAGHAGGWCTTPVTEAALLRLSLNPSVVGRAVTAREALAVLAALRQHPAHRFVPDASTLDEPSIDLGRFTGSRQVTDLHLVNLAAVNGLVLVTLDRGIADLLTPADHHFIEVLTG